VRFYCQPMLEHALKTIVASHPYDVPICLPGRNGPEGQGPRNLYADPSHRAAEPADALSKLLGRISTFLRFYSNEQTTSGPFPVSEARRPLANSRNPSARVGRGLALTSPPFFSFLRRCNSEPDVRSDRTFHRSWSLHEVAHQCGAMSLAWSAYRDQWMRSPVQLYCAAVSADNQKMPILPSASG